MKESDYDYGINSYIPMSVIENKKCLFPPLNVGITVSRYRIIVGLCVYNYNTSKYILIRMTMLCCVPTITRQAVLTYCNIGN